MEVFNYFESNGKSHKFIDLKFIPEISHLPYVIRVLMENNFFYLLNKDKKKVLKNIASPLLHFNPSRILMQDYTAIPLLVDWLTFHERILSQDPGQKSLEPLISIDIVIDHSLQADFVSSSDAYRKNLEIEYTRNEERFNFLKWVSQKYKNINIIPPGNGICHQLNLEKLSSVVVPRYVDESLLITSETVIGTDSHTTMINGLSVLGWGVGGLEAESVMLGEPILMEMPEVIKIDLQGYLDDKVHITEAALYLTEQLRKKGVVGKFLEFGGEGLSSLSVPHRATIANMTPEYGATCSYFPIDNQVLTFLEGIGKTKAHIDLVEKYANAQGLWYREDVNKKYTEVIELNLSDLKPSIAGPKRPQDRLELKDAGEDFYQKFGLKKQKEEKEIDNGSIVIASITSCTNTSNPEVIFAAALLCKKATELNLKIPSYIKTSFSPGSRVVEEYLLKSDLLPYMKNFGFDIIGFGCATCCGNSGKLDHTVEEKIEKEQLVVCSILSGNRNFEGRIHKLVKANYLASPPLVVAYALMGTMGKNIEEHVFGYFEGREIYLKDIWPTKKEIDEYIKKYIKNRIFDVDIKYSEKGPGEALWNSLKISQSTNYDWDDKSTYIRKPNFITQRVASEQKLIENGRILLILGDSITTDHISPVGEITMDSEVGKYLTSMGVKPHDFNSLGSRRGNHEVMMRAAFGNANIKNKMIDDKIGPFTKIFPSGEEYSIFNASRIYEKENVPLVIFGGRDYGTGSSRDWAAKGPYMLGVRAVIVESFERIHRSNLIGMGIFPFKLTEHNTLEKLNIKGDEIVNIFFLNEITSNSTAICEMHKSGKIFFFPLKLDINNDREIDIIRCGGIFNYAAGKILPRVQNILNSANEKY